MAGDAGEEQQRPGAAAHGRSAFTVNV